MTPGKTVAVDLMVELLEAKLREPRPDRGGRTIDDYRHEAARRRRPAGTNPGDSK